MGFNPANEQRALESLLARVEERIENYRSKFYVGTKFDVTASVLEADLNWAAISIRRAIRELKKATR
jgi:hypothetical protein